MTPLSRHLIDFIDRLRAGGVRISTAESIDAMNAVAAAGIERAAMREALAAALVKDEADRPAYDAAFDRFFAAPPRKSFGRQHPEHPGIAQSAGVGRGAPGESPREAKASRAKSKAERRAKSVAHPLPEKDAQAEQSGIREAQGEEGARIEAARDHSKEATARVPGEEDTNRAEAGRIAAERRALERLPFAAFTDLDYERAKDALDPLKRRFRARLGRRLKSARRGRIDFRRTIRAAIQHGGAMAELRHRARRPRHVELVILADISGSVRYAAELMLEISAGARESFKRVRTFVYIDRVAEADFEQRHLVTSPVLDPYARSDFGRVLEELWERRAEILTRQTLLVILGDARNNRRPARADLLREIARAVRAVVWLNPEEPARWGIGDSVIDRYAREVAAVLPSRNLHELERGLLSLA